MDTKLFWQLMEDICQLGEFIADMEIKGAETNIRGTLQVGYDGLNMVLERQDCHDHIHLAPEYIQAIHFGYYQVSTGRMDPCIELINVDDQVCLTLLYYPYQVNELKPKHKQFMEQNQTHGNYLTGEW
ncbi:MAG TPA: hypothetical protein VFC02_09855 [Anaerolineales bacterium]|nr:hypothetical protein [Anaerolineales bacterium]